MPFTLAHPAAVLPLRSRWRDGFLALIIGSVGPDIPYFLPRRIGDAVPTGHTVLGALVIGAPLALGLLIFVVLCRRIVVAPLWGGLRLAVERELERVRHSRAAWLQAVPATILGTEIHALWDSFTHKTGWIVLHAPMLSHDVSPLAGHHLPLYKALQYLSSIAGLAVIYIWCRRRLRGGAGAEDSVRWKRWGIFACALPAVVAAWNALQRVGWHPRPPHTVEYVAATAALGTFTVLYLALGAIILVVRARRERFRTSG